MAADETKRIPLGSGKIYSVEYTGSTLPSDEEIETPENQIGFVSGGASLEYKPTYQEIKDDFEEVYDVLLTEDEATLKADVMTHLGEKFDTICNTADISTDNSTKITTVKIGGEGNFKFEKRVFRFVNDSKKYGKTRITLVGYNSNGFAISYKKSEAGLASLEIKGLACDEKGTKIIYSESPLATTGS